MTLVASIEAAHIFGWPKIKTSLQALQLQWRAAVDAFERDSQVSPITPASLTHD